MSSASSQRAILAPGLSWCAATSRGGRRENQDRFGARRGAAGALFVVCDGLGGHRGGEVAASHAVDRFLEAVARSGSLDLATLAREESRELVELGRRRPDCEGLGTTVAALLVRPGGAHWVAAGDSRLYLRRGGSVGLLAEPHDLARILLREGVLSEEEAATSPMRGRVTSYLGQDGPETASGRLTLRRGDAVALLTDGVMEGGEERVARILATREPAGAVQELVRGIRTQDNATALVVAIERAEAPCSAS